MGRIGRTITKERLENLYRGKKLSLKKVASVLGCTDVTVAGYMRRFDIPRRDKATMRVKYRKLPFSGTDEDKAYMIGFRLGDLNVYKPYSNSQIYVARCHTTHSSQSDLIRELFGPYGGVKVSFTDNGYTINCFLDTSFEFLYPKELPSWIFSNRSSIALAFIAGYTDAEGSFGLNQGRGRFKIDSYDYAVLKNIYDFLTKTGINPKFRMIASRGSRRGLKIWNGDLWRLNINIAGELEKFICSIRPFMRHRNRLAGAGQVLANVKKRNHHGSTSH